jgi:hypothetical protein
MFNSFRSGCITFFILTGFASGCASGSTSSQSTQSQSLSRNTQELVYVSNKAANSITAFASTAAGNAKPVITISGSNTKLDRPAGLAFDSSGKLYVVNQGLHASSITIYAPNATGNVTPIGMIAGPQTHLRAQAATPDYPTGAIAVDSVHGRLFIGRISTEQSPYPNNVLVFDLHARGNVSPLKSIGVANAKSTKSDNTDYGLEPAPTLALDVGSSAAEIIVGTERQVCCNLGDGWTYYDDTGLTANKSAELYSNLGLYGLATMPRSENVVVSSGGGLEIWPGKITGTLGGPTDTRVPLRTISGGASGFGAIAVDAQQTIWALVRGTGAQLPQTTGAAQINAYPVDTNTPVVIRGSATGLSGVSGIAIAP